MTTKQKAIIKLYKKGTSKLGISKKVGVSRTYVYKVLTETKLYAKSK